MLQAVGQFGLRLLRWRVTGQFPDVAKAVFIVAPHTSNWDFFVGLFADLALDLRAHWLGKHTIFRWPVNGLLRSLGGIPIERSSRSQVVEQMVGEFAAREALVLAIAPEGTRKKVDEWRTGFWHIAKGAGVPIVPIGLDYAKREVLVGPVRDPTDDLAADVRACKAFFSTVVARHPNQF